MSATVLLFRPRDRKRDNFKFRLDDNPIVDIRDDLMMDHADNGIPSDSPYSAPEIDPA